MPSFNKPGATQTRGFLATQANLDFIYPAVGATAAVPQSGYGVNRTRIKIGGGQDVFAAARAALERAGSISAWAG